MPDHKLVLHPINPRAILQDPGLFLDTLRGWGLAGASFSHLGELHYRAGPRFQELLVFKTPPALADCHLSLLETLPAAIFLGASNVQTPLCPGCHGAIADWRKQLATLQSESWTAPWSCPKCGRRFPVGRVDWQHSAGVARYAVDVWGVREHEAVPSDELLTALERETGESWAFFYYRF